MSELNCTTVRLVYNGELPLMVQDGKGSVSLSIEDTV